MKTLMKSLFTAALLAVGVSQSFAAVDMFLKITDVKGESKIVKLRCDDGACKSSVDDMKAGKYTFTLTDAKGNALKVKEKGNRTKSMSMNFAKITFEYEIKSPRDVATGQSSGKSAANQGDPIHGVDIKNGVQSPRDLATGQASGKRQHGYIKITKELDAHKTFVAAGDVNGDGRLDVVVSCTWKEGGLMAIDDWESPLGVN